MDHTREEFGAQVLQISSLWMVLWGLHRCMQTIQNAIEISKMYYAMLEKRRNNEKKKKPMR